MPVTDKQMILLMAHLAGEEQVARRVQAELVTSGTAEGFAELVCAAFVIVARQRFSPTWTRADVIRFVAQVRALLSEQPDALDALAAEHQLRSALGEEMASHPDKEAGARAQVILLDVLVQSADLDVLVQSADLDEAAITNLLNQARGLADRMLAEPATGT